MGANLIGGGATFRCWAPRASAVYLCGQFSGTAQWNPLAENLLVRDANGYWTGFVPGVQEGDQYKFCVNGAGDDGYKRDPYARELSTSPSFPHCNCIVRNPNPYLWHDQAFVTPPASEQACRAGKCLLTPPPARTNT